MARTRTRSPVRRPATGGRQAELVIDHVGARGDGVATLDGKPVFVPLTVPGDRVRIRVAGSRAGGLAAEILELLAPGPTRAEPPCPVFGRCGGCALQQFDPAAYVAWKHGQVTTALARAGLDAVPVAPLLQTPPATRRRAEFTAKRAGGHVVLGFNERFSHWIVDIDDCLVLDPAIVALMPALRRTLADTLPDGTPLDLAVTRLEGGLDLLITGGAEPGLAAREAWAALAETADLGRLSWRAAAGRRAEPLAHRRPVGARFGDVLVALPPGGFLQASAFGEAALVEGVLTAIEGAVGDAGRVADLFAGAGTFTFPLARRARVTAVEGDAAAIEALRLAARGLPGVEAVRRDLFADPLGPDELSGFDAVVFDPPRAGAAGQAAALAQSGVPLVVGVSCAPATFARDARTLVAGGYRLDGVTPVDQFLWSPHVELVGVFRRG